MSDNTEDQALEDALEKSTEATPAADAPATEAAPAVKKKASSKKKAGKKKTSPAVPEANPAQAQADKTKADADRREKAIADAPRPPDPSKEDKAEQKRKDDIRAKMAETQAEIDDLEAGIDEKKDELLALSSELYPHLVESDHHTTAVKGYIESQKNLRRTRASSPETLKRMLAEAGKAPIDAAMSRKKARGGQRPTRPGVTPGNAAASE